MEIIHLILGKANPDRMNGVNKVVYQLATKQAEFGEKVAVWGIVSDKEENYGSRNFETRLFLKTSFPFFFSKELKEAILEKKGKAVFHLHGGWIPVYFLLAKLLYRHNIKFVITAHGAYNTIAMKKSSMIKALYFRFFERRILETADSIHCIGKSEVHGLKKIFKKDNVVLLPYGFVNNYPVETKGPNKENIIFGFIGRLDIYTKGLDTLLHAFKKFHYNYPDSKLWIVGDSNERETLQHLISKNHLDKNVVLYGSKFGDEKNELLQKMDVFVHPSRNEGLPLSVIEAASFGKPCIVTDSTNIGHEIANYNAGETIYSQNENKLEAAMVHMVKVFNDPGAFVVMQQNAMRMVQEEYNWEKLLLKFRNNLYHM
ncbi:glycosyltransferase family 4 protein [Flavobacterium suzhouense]|uniref:Glycosyltransferase family 4 protein n=1 Tax=Flavobacterium suzhouense TaxID=1529638 RepID=A0ABW5NV50_9FLAO